jgi:hypothetical protein
MLRLLWCPDLSVSSGPGRGKVVRLASRFPPQQNGSSPIVFPLTKGKITDAANKQAVESSYKALSKAPHVASAPDPFANAASGLVSKDARTAFTPVLLDIPNGDVTDEIANRILDTMAWEGAAHRRDGHTDAQDTGDQAPLSGRDLVWEHRHQGGEQCVEEQLGSAPSDEDHRDVGCQRHHEDAQRTAHQADHHPGPPHAQRRGGAVAHLAEERIRHHGQQGGDPGDNRQAARCLLDPHERVDLQCQGDQQGREEQQAGADERQGVQRDEPPSDPAGLGRLVLQPSLGDGPVLESVQPARRWRADSGGRWKCSPRDRKRRAS